MNALLFTQNIRFGTEFAVFFKGGSGVSDSKALFGSGTPRNIGLNYGTFMPNGIAGIVKIDCDTCRANFNNKISSSLKSLKDGIASFGKEILLDFSPVVIVAKKQLKDFKQDRSNFAKGIKNIYDDSLDINLGAANKCPKKFGNSKIDIYAIDKQSEMAIADVAKLIPVLDAIVANSCVLLDRDSCAEERRKFFGRAGEYSINDGYLSYHTLGNFWLRSQQLSSFVMGMIRFAVHIVGQSTPNCDYVRAIHDLVPQDLICEAIQTNNFELAKSNFDKLSPLIVEMAGESGGSYPLTKHSIKEFNHFVKMGMDYWVKELPLAHWTDNHKEGHGQGIESYLTTKIRTDMLDKREFLKETSLNEIWDNVITHN